jgi:hypothetical protein
MQNLSMKIFFLSATILLFCFTSTTAQTASDTVYSNTEPAMGWRKFLVGLEKSLSASDTIGRRHRMRLNNIGFFVNTSGSIDSAWVTFRPRPIHEKIIQFLKSTNWRPASVDGKAVVSQQELLEAEIYLTKAALKRHGHWRTLPERILSPWSN